MKEVMFPGCSLIQSAKDYYFSIKEILKYLGKEIEDLPEWECCGATVLPSIAKKEFEEVNKRNVEKAMDLKVEKIISPCSSCYVNLRKFSRDKIEVIHLLYYLYKLREKIKKRSEIQLNLKVIPYYGCQTVRPFCEENMWNPVAMDEILKICRYKVINFPYKTKCCGALITQIEPNKGNKIIVEIFKDFINEIDVVSVVCPLCRVNLESAFLRYKIKKPVLYLTQLIGISFGIEKEKLLIGKSLISLKHVKCE